MCNKKTKIYQTIKGLIILFIKLQFSIKCNQAFRSLSISTSNIYLNLSFNPNGFVTCIIPNAFVSSQYTCILSIRRMIPDVHLQKSLHPIKSSPSLHTHQTWGSLVYLPEGLCYSCQCLDVVMEDKADVCTKEKS